jgi:hypothetical protein
MSIKNKRTSVSNTDSAVEKRLKAKLKEDFDKFLHEDDEDLEDDSAAPAGDLGSGDLGADGDMGDLGDAGGDPNADPAAEESPEDVQLTPSQEEWMDSEVDTLLGSAMGVGDQGMTDDDDLSLDEDDDMGIDGDVSIEGDADVVDDGLGNLDGEQPSDNEELPGDFTVDELNQIIDAPNTLDMFDNAIRQHAAAHDDDADGGLGVGADMDNDEDNMNMEAEESDGEELNEADLVGSLSDIGWEEDELGVDGDSKDYTKFPADLDFEATEHDGKAAVNTKGTEWESGTPAKGSEITTVVKESVKKSKMLVKAAQAIVKLQEANAKLKIENQKLNKVNGIFAAVGDKLSKTTRKKIAESFDKCKSEKEINTLYTKVVKVITEKKETTLNEVVKKSKAPLQAVPNNGKKLNEASQKELTHEQKRINFLMGMNGVEDMYFG